MLICNIMFEDGLVNGARRMVVGFNRQMELNISLKQVPYLIQYWLNFMMHVLVESTLSSVMFQRLKLPVTAKFYGR